jgi:hypothetical protein
MTGKVGTVEKPRARGNRLQVFRGTALKTAGGFTLNDFVVSKSGKFVLEKSHKRAKARFNKKRPGGSIAQIFAEQRAQNKAEGIAPPLFKKGVKKTTAEREAISRGFQIKREKKEDKVAKLNRRRNKDGTFGSKKIKVEGASRRRRYKKK